MTDWGACEFDHFMWDVFDNDGDRMVPLRGAELDKQYELQGESCKKKRNDTSTVIERNVACNGLAASQQDAGATSHSSSLIGKPNIFECQHPYMSHNVYPLPCSAGCMPSFANSASASSQWLNDCFESHSVVTNSNDLCSSYPSLGDTAAFDENSLHPFSLEISAVNDNLDFLENESKFRENDDILDYGWPETPDIGNFEDFEKIFSDTTNSRGCSGASDELPWLSAKSIIGGSDDPLKSTPQYSSSQSYSANLDINNEEKLDLTSRDQVLPSKKLKQSQRKRKFSVPESRNSDYRASSDLASPCNNKSCPSFIASADQTSFFQLEGSGDYMSNCTFSGSCSHCAVVKQSLSPKQITAALTICEKETKLCVLDKVSSQALNDRYLSMARAHDPLRSNSTLTVEKKVQEGYLGQQQQLSKLPRSHTVSENESPPIICDQHSFDKNLHKFETVEGGKCCREEASKNCHTQHNIYSMDMGSQNMSIGRTTLQHLQDAIKQLDVRTRLCIRDGLYRLARSAQDRHSADGTRPSCRERRNAGSVFGATHSKSEFMEGETATNAIDRSIAHLLFHGAPEYSPEDAVSIESYVTSEENCAPSSRLVNYNLPAFPEYLGKHADGMLLGSENY